MRTRASWMAVFVSGVFAYTPPAVAQVDQQRAQAYFKEAEALCERDGGRLWGVAVCAPMVIGDARTQTFATSQPPPDAPRPRGVGYVNAPMQWGGVTWIAYIWDDLANAPPWRRNEILLHEMFQTNTSTYSTDAIGCSSNGERLRGRSERPECSETPPFATR